MRQLSLVTIFIFTFSSFANAQLAQRVASYDIQVHLDTEKEQTTANQVLTWTNPSSDVITELQFHLYYNAFKNNQSTFFKEIGGAKEWLSEERLDDCAWGWMEVQEITDEAGNSLKNKMSYIHPDDDNADDQTVLKVELEQPISPNQTATFNINWTAKIPRLTIRTGQNLDYYFMAQWFPKVGVYEPKGMRGATEGRWNCHQYHRNTEYYADFGVYKVSIDVPQNYVVGASGHVINETKNDDRKIVTYYVEDVIDFTWTAYPNFVEVNTQWKEVKIRLLHHPDRACVVDRYLTATKNALEYLDKHVGEYPYPTLTVVDPPYHGIRSSAMEYPTIVTGAGLTCFPEGIRTTESITTHEIVHQYFMQMIATNEQEEAWMDEGFTSYYEGRIVDHYYGNILEENWTGFKASNADWRRMRFFLGENPKAAISAMPGWFFKHGAYRNKVYSKPALMLRTLEGLLGQEKMDSLMKRFFETWKFKHPSGQDFFDVANAFYQEETEQKYGKNLNWLFDQLIFGTNMSDFAIHEIKNSDIEQPLGFFDDLYDCDKPIPSKGDSLEAKVILYRLGEIQQPCKIRIEFDNGEEIIEEWNGQERTYDFTYIGSRKIVCAEIDPFDENPFDENSINNSFQKNAGNKGILKTIITWMTWLQQNMQAVTLVS